MDINDDQRRTWLGLKVGDASTWDRRVPDMTNFAGRMIRMDQFFEPLPALVLLGWVFNRMKETLRH